MKNKQIISFTLIIILVVSLHVGIFVVYDLYKNSGHTIAKIKKKIIYYSELDKKVQTKKHDTSMRRKYVPKSEHTQSVKSKIYSWVDSSGTQHFSDMLPNEAVNNLKVRTVYASDDLGESEIIAKRIDQNPSRSPITRVVVRGDRIFVPVRLGYRGKEVQAMLLLDTGASTTVIHSEAASKLVLWDRFKTKSIVANGRKINTEIAYLDYIQVGPHRLKNFAVSIIDYSGDNDHYTGLLGMNFIRNTEYRIHYAKQFIRWE
ncbi:MAG: retropepsin-like aspartic protease [Desulfovermiculus sp.]|nr:retropepsin-like aspartic protease [Desulfovermiculus sp.]